MVLVVDDSEDVSAAAREFLEYLFIVNKKDHVKSDAKEILSRLEPEVGNRICEL